MSFKLRKICHPTIRQRKENYEPRMKETRYSAMPREKLVNWLAELKEQEEQLNQESAKLNRQYNELQRQEQEYTNRRQKAASESNEERQLRELWEKIQQEKKKCRHVKGAFYLKLSFLIVGAVAFFGYNAMIKGREYNGGLEYQENENLYQAAVSDKELEYQNKEIELENKYEYSVMALENSRKELENKYNNLIKEKESDYLAQKESLEEDIRNYKLSHLNTGSETEMREYLNSLPIRSTKSVENMYDDMGIPYYVCREKYNLPYYGNIDAGTNIIYPGAIIKGDTLFSDNYAVAPVKCGSADLVCSIQGSPILTVDEVSYGNVRRELDAYQELSKNERYKVSNYEYDIVHSQAEINANLGISGKVGSSVSIEDIDISADIGGSTNFGMSYQEKKTNLLVTIYQIAYTVNVQPRQDSLDFFAEGADILQLGSYAPAYISSVDYGRKIVILISSDDTEDELTNAIKNGLHIKLPAYELDDDIVVSAEAGGESEAAYNKLVERDKATCNIIVIGGNAEATSFPSMKVSTCMDELSKLLAEEENGIVNPVPIFYKMNYIYDNSAVPCVQVAREVKFLKDEVEIIQLQWIDNKSIKGTVSCEIKGVGMNTFVVGSNILSVEKGEAKNNVVYVFTKKDAECTVTINQKKEKRRWYSSELYLDSDTQNVKIYDEKRLSKFNLSAVYDCELPDIE